MIMNVTTNLKQLTGFFLLHHSIYPAIFFCPRKMYPVKIVAIDGMYVVHYINMINIINVGNVVRSS